MQVSGLGRAGALGTPMDPSRTFSTYATLLPMAPALLVTQSHICAAVMLGVLPACVKVQLVASNTSCRLLARLVKAGTVRLQAVRPRLLHALWPVQ